MQVFNFNVLFNWCRCSIQRLLQNSKSLSSTRKNHSAKTLDNQRHFCSLEITFQKADNKVIDEKKSGKHKKKLFFSKKGRVNFILFFLWREGRVGRGGGEGRGVVISKFALLIKTSTKLNKYLYMWPAFWFFSYGLLGDMLFPEDLDQFFKCGSTSTHTCGDQVVPAPATALENENFTRMQLKKHCNTGEKQPFQSKYKASDCIPAPITFPETPMKKHSKFFKTGSEFEVLRPHIVPETPLQIQPNDDRESSRVLCVPETPVVDMSKIPFSYL